MWIPLLLACRDPETDGTTPSTAHTSAPDPSGETGESGRTATTGDTGTPIGGPIRAVADERCPLLDTIGQVTLLGSAYGSPIVYASLWDGPDPWFGPPTETTPTCAYHTFSPGVCGTCDPGETCAFSGTCVPERRSIKDGTLVIRADGERRTFETDPKLGGLYGTVDLGDDETAFGMTLTWDGVEIEVDPMTIASGDLGRVHVRVASNAFFAPGDLDATWDAPADGGHVWSRIPINHHAAGPTFTECTAEAASEAFHAEATMIDPLTVVTGLEFQGLEHHHFASARTPDGCVEFRFGRQQFVGVEVPP